MNKTRDDIANNPAIGGNWRDLRAEIFTPEEITESDLRVALIGELNVEIRESENSE
ncbi:MAG TPA: hypothetical protein H9685_03790 [Firmicutes bacterium]|nr:hypothetical protein [Bacillota bacterium]